MLKRIFTRTALTSLLLTLAAQNLLAEVPAVLEKVPAEAAVVIVVKDMKDFSGKLGNYATRMNLPNVPPDILGEFTKTVHISKGLDTKGSFAFSFCMPPKAKDADNPPAYTNPSIMIFPVADQKALLEEYTAGPAANGITELSVPDSPVKLYVAFSGKFAIFAQEKAYLEHYLGGKEFLAKKITPEFSKTIEASDGAIYANIEAFSPTVVQSMDMFAPMIKGQMMNRPGVNPTQLATQRATFDTMFSTIRSILVDGQNAVLSVKLPDAGATIGLSAQFKPESESAKKLATLKPLPADPLVGLPNGTVLGTGAATLNSTLFTGPMDIFFEQLSNDPQNPDPQNAEKMKKYQALMKEMMGLLKDAKLVAFEPKPGQKGVIHGLSIYTVTNTQRYLEISKEFKKDNNLLSAGQPITVDITATSTSTIGGLTFTKEIYTYKLKPEMENDEVAKQSLEMVTKMYGGPMTVYTAIPDPEHVIFATGCDETQIADAATAYLTKSTALASSADIKAVSKEVLPNSAFVGYVAVDRIISLGKAFAANHGELPTTLPAVDPTNVVVKDKVLPLTFSIGAQAGQIKTQAYLPMSALVNIAQSAMEGMAPQGEPAPMMAPPGQ